MKLFRVALMAAALGLLAPEAGAQDIAYPRFSPLPVRQAADADPTPLSLPFGVPLRVVERGTDHVLVLLADGRQVRVRPGDVVIPAGTAQAVAGPGFGIEGRVRLSFWDSPLRAQGFLRDGPSDQTRPLLVEAGASLENVPYSYTPLAYAAYNNRQQALRYLLGKGARVDADASERLTYINTPLMMAAIQGHRDIVRLLLQAGADPLVRVRGGHTAREFAQKYRHSHVEPLIACAESLPAGQNYLQYCERSARVATNP